MSGGVDVPGDLPDSAAEKANQAIGIYVPEGVLEKVRHVHRVTKRSFSNIVLDAVEITYKDLKKAFQQLEEERERTHLFDRPSERARRGNGEHQTLVIKVTPRNKAIIDSIVSEAHASSRSALLSKALEIYTDAEQV